MFLIVKGLDETAGLGLSHLFSGHHRRPDRSDGRDGHPAGGRDGSAEDNTSLNLTAQPFEPQRTCERTLTWQVRVLAPSRVWRVKVTAGDLPLPWRRRTAETWMWVSVGPSVGFCEQCVESWFLLQRASPSWWWPGNWPPWISGEHRKTFQILKVPKANSDSIYLF